VAAVKLKPTVCESGEMGEAGGAGFPASGPLGRWRAGGAESRSCRSVCLAARSLGVGTLACVTGASCLSRAMSWAVLSRTPISPVHGVPTTSGSITAGAVAGEPRIRLQPCANRPIHRRGDFIHQARCRAGRDAHRVRTKLWTACGGEGTTAAACNCISSLNHQNLRAEVKLLARRSIDHHVHVNERRTPRKPALCLAKLRREL